MAENAWKAKCTRRLALHALKTRSFQIAPPPPALFQPFGLPTLVWAWQPDLGAAQVIASRMSDVLLWLRRN